MGQSDLALRPLESSDATASVERVPGAGTESVAAVVVPDRGGDDGFRRLRAALAAQSGSPERSEVQLADDRTVGDCAPLTAQHAGASALRPSRDHARRP